MPETSDTLEQLRRIPKLTVCENVLLSQYTRFGIGGPADILAETANVDAFAAALRTVRAGPFTIIGAGTNLIVSDAGFRGAVLRFTAATIAFEGGVARVDAGGVLQDLVNASIEQGLRGLETLTGIPGWVGAAIYGNAGAYGHSISERVRAVRFFDGREVRLIGNAECEFHYRESAFKRHKDWIILSAELELDRADSAELRKIAGEILEVRNAKYPPAMKCAGSIFKNLLLDELAEPVRAQVPAKVIREGKVPSAYFLEQAGAKGMANGDIRVADYHANLIYNQGRGTAAQLRAVIGELKMRVKDRWGLELEEEVQYVGF